MAFISIQPTNFFNTLLYTGNNTDARSITGVGFQPDMTWIKQSSGTNNHMLSDSARGGNNKINPNTTAANDTATNSLQAFGADGFTAGTNTEINASGSDYASWNWKGGTTSGITTDGSTTITPSAYSFSADAGISILKYTGNTTSGAGLAHGMGKKPAFFVAKDLSTTESWTVFHHSLGPTKFLSWNGTGAESTATNRWNDTDPTTTNMILGSETSVNNTNMMGYCFAEVPGFSRFGRFRGNGSVDGSFVFTGFRPAFLIIKKYSGAGDGWYMVDNKNNPSNRVNKNLFVDTSGALSTAGTAASDKNMDFLSNGFKVRTTNGEVNQSNEQYVYMAFAEFPFVSSNSKPGVAR
jgi:hypothetical protein